MVQLGCGKNQGLTGSESVPELGCAQQEGAGGGVIKKRPGSWPHRVGRGNTSHTHTHTHTQHARAQAQYWSNSIRWRFSSVSVPQNHLEACGNRSGQAHSPEFLPQVWCRWAGALPGGPLSGSRAVRVSIWKCSRSKYEQAHLEKAGTLTGCLCGTMSHLNMLAKGRKTSAQAD